MSESLFQKYLLMPFGYTVPWDEAKAGRLLWGYKLLSNLLSPEIKTEEANLGKLEKEALQRLPI